MTDIVPMRTERVPLKMRKFKEASKSTPTFQKDYSVFSAWRDNNFILDQHDFYKWKLTRFIKTESDQDEIKAFFRVNEHLQDFKEFFANLQSESNCYPGVS